MLDNNSESKVLQVVCKGTPYEIGFQHGAAASTHITRSIAFYEKLFIQFTNRKWALVRDTARAFEAEIHAKWPRYHQEMKGIAEGSSHELLDIVALNVRTEIAFGLFYDGCTSLSWKTEKRSFLGQNWDWMEQQKENLIITDIWQEGYPRIKMITEAGIIGKIGLNSAGVGVCLNAIRAKGLDPTRLPVHLGLRMVLECRSAGEAVLALKGAGLASSAHLLIADPCGAVGLEFTSTTMATLSPDECGRIYHSNHLLEKIIAGTEVQEPVWLIDSRFRIGRMQSLAKEYDISSRETSWAEFSRLFDDHEEFPCSICRAQEGVSKDASLFNIVMDLKERRAVILMGRPCQAEETIHLQFE